MILCNELESGTSCWFFQFDICRVGKNLFGMIQVSVISLKPNFRILCPYFSISKISSRPEFLKSLSRSEFPLIFAPWHYILLLNKPETPMKGSNILNLPDHYYVGNCLWWFHVVLSWCHHYHSAWFPPFELQEKSTDYWGRCSDNCVYICQWQRLHGQSGGQVVHSSYRPEILHYAWRDASHLLKLFQALKVQLWASTKLFPPQRGWCEPIGPWTIAHIIFSQAAGIVVDCWGKYHLLRSLYHPHVFLFVLAFSFTLLLFTLTFISLLLFLSSLFPLWF